MTIQKQVNELTSLSSFADSNVIPVHDGNGLKKGTVTQLATNLASKFSNPNLLINPNFAINQRGDSTYTGNASTKTYTVDRWYVFGASCTVTVNSDGTITVKNSGSSESTFAQISESTYSNVTASINISSYSGTVKLFTNNATKTITASGTSSVSDSGLVNTCGVKLASGASVTIKWMKLENGKNATTFEIPKMAEEMMKSMRYFYKSVFKQSGQGQASQQFGGAVSLPNYMRTTPSIRFNKSYIFNADSADISFLWNKNSIFIYANAIASQITVIEGYYTLDAEIY